MAFPLQKDVVSKIATTFIGIEAVAYGTLSAAMVQVFPMETPKFTRKRTQHKVTDERARGFAHVKNRKGLKSAEMSAPFPLKPPAAPLNAAATPATPWLGTILKALLGGEASGAGSTVASAADEDTITVAAGHGSRFKRGQWIAVEVGTPGSGTLEPARVINISTDTLTLWPKLTAVPQADALVHNSYTYYPTQSNSQSVSYQHAKAGADGANYQDVARGGTGELELKAERDALLQIAVNMKFADFDPPGAHGVSTDYAADPMSEDMVVAGAYCIVQPVTETERSHYALQSHGWKLNGGQKHTEETGGINGTTGVVRIPSRPFASMTVKHRADHTVITELYEDQTTLGMVCVFSEGSGLTKKFVVVDIPSAFISDEPDLKGEGDLQVVEYPAEAMEDTTTTTAGLSGTLLDLALAPGRIALIG